MAPRALKRKRVLFITDIAAEEKGPEPATAGVGAAMPSAQASPTPTLEKESRSVAAIPAPPLHDAVVFAEAYVAPCSRNTCVDVRCYIKVTSREPSASNSASCTS